MLAPVCKNSESSEIHSAFYALFNDVLKIMWFWPTELTLFRFVEKYKIVHSTLKLNSNIGHDDTQNQVLAGTTMFVVIVTAFFC